MPINQPPDRRTELGPGVALEAFQMFRILGFESLAQSLNLADDEKGVVQYMAGTAMGRALVRKGTIKGDDLNLGLGSFGVFYQKMGLGMISMRYESGDLLVAIAECAGCAGNTPADRAICFVEAGLISGLVSELSGREYYGQEEKCIGGLGDAVCEFRLSEGR